MLMRKLLSACYGLENEYAKQLQDRSLLALQALGTVINHMASFVKAAKTRVIVNMCATASKNQNSIVHLFEYKRRIIKASGASLDRKIDASLYIETY